MYRALACTSRPFSRVPNIPMGLGRVNRGMGVGHETEIHGIWWLILVWTNGYQCFMVFWEIILKQIHAITFIMSMACQSDQFVCTHGICLYSLKTLKPNPHPQHSKVLKQVEIVGPNEILSLGCRCQRVWLSTPSSRKPHFRRIFHVFSFEREGLALLLMHNSSQFSN